MVRITSSTRSTQTPNFSFTRSLVTIGLAEMRGVFEGTSFVIQLLNLPKKKALVGREHDEKSAGKTSGWARAM